MVNRADKRERDRQILKLKKAAGKLTNKQLELIDLLAQQQTDKLLDVFKDIITKSMVEAMRENRISVERAEKVIEKANMIIERKVLENEYRGNYK